MNLPDSPYSGPYSQGVYSKPNPYAIAGDAVKVELTDAPDLGLGSQLNHNQPATDYNAPPVFRFGSESTSSSSPKPFAFMAGHQWPQTIDPPVSSSDNSSPYPSHTPSVNFNLPPISNQPISFHDDYDDGDDNGELSLLPDSSAQSADKSLDKQIRRRSSKGMCHNSPNYSRIFL